MEISGPDVMRLLVAIECQRGYVGGAVVRRDPAVAVADLDRARTAALDTVRQIDVMRKRFGASVRFPSTTTCSRPARWLISMG
ncbi:hypothetical protein ACFOVU_11415 [Nocardiopsis sediminis]|uniref:Uncharacterized protein n=1 Tax=Nocardiopsis sediminis TaxID=1778267 RepID=A0ABV8FP67_9ACTN